MGAEIGVPDRVKPLAIDLFCGLGGWTEGAIAAGYEVVGFDIEVRPYPARSNARKAASAQIAKIPFALARYVAESFKPK